MLNSGPLMVALSIFSRCNALWRQEQGQVCVCSQVLYLPLSLIYGVVHIFWDSRNLRDGEIEILTARHLQAKSGSAASRLLEAATTLLSAGPLTAVLCWLCPMSCCVAAVRVWMSPLSSYGTASMGIFETEKRGKNYWLCSKLTLIHIAE